MKLYVCYGTWVAGRPVHRHPCGEAQEALAAAGYRPEVVRTLGLGLAPDAINALTKRREVKRLTGQYWVPALVTDDGEAMHGSQRIIEWARTHPAPGRADAAAPAA